MLVIISSASAGEPQDVVEHKLGMVVELLYEDGESDDSAEMSDDDRKAEVRKIVYDTFDFEKLSILALSREKKEFSDFQYDRFLNLFSEILFNTYYNRIRNYQVIDISYKGERIFNKVKAEVKTVVETVDHTYTIDYRLTKTGDEWRVYDVVIEGVSLVRNYRSQFASILRSKSPDHLIEMLGKKVETENTTVTTTN